MPERFLAIWEGVIMKITAAVCVVVSSLVFLPACQPASAMSPPDADEKPIPAELPTTAPWLLHADTPDQPIKRAETVENALAYSEDEKIILDDVRDGDGQLSSSAMYVLLRRAQMLPEGDETLEEAESPSPKKLWDEPGRYRGRLVHLKVLYAGSVTPWTDNVVSTRWWGKRSVWMVHVLVEAKKTKPPTYDRMVVVMGHEPPKNLKNRQPLELVGLFYKLAKLREDAKKGDPDVKNEYPVIVASALYPTPSDKALSDESTFKWGSTVLIIAVMVMLFVFMRLKRGVARQRAAGVQEYHPSRSDTPDDADADADDGQVDEELLRQIELHQLDKRDEDADNA